MQQIKFQTYSALGEQLLKFKTNYKQIKLYIPPEPKDKPKRIAKSQMTCRFCGKKRPEVNFKSDPHIIPVLFGKNYGVSDFECDTCNNLFSLNETHTADYLSLIRTVNTISANRTPIFKSPKDSLTARMSQIFSERPALEIADNSGEGFEIDNVSGIVKINYLKKPHIPFNVYKCLLKIALTVLPEEYVKDYIYAFNMIRSGQGQEHFLGLAKIHQSIVDFTASKPYCMLFEKLNQQSKLPTHVFALYFHNIIYQFPIPVNLNDHKIYEEGVMDMIFCPPLFVEPNNKIVSSSGIVDLSIVDTVNDSKGCITFNSDPLLMNNLDAYDTATNTFIDKPFNPEKIVKIFLEKDNNENN